MDRKLQGNIGEAKAILYYTEKGYEVFLPTVNASDIDLIAVKGTELIRVQVKTTSYRTAWGTFEVGLATNGGNQSWNRVHKTISSEFVDEVFMWSSDDSIWVMPSAEVEGKKKIALSYIRRQFKLSGPNLYPPKRRKPPP